jgi:hypothetical protein
MPRKPLPENMLDKASPQLVKEWHPTKNGDLRPNQVSIGSTKKVWWKCPQGDDHEWAVSPNSRGKGGGCPVCSGRKVVKSNCLATTHPDIAEEWHPTKNGEKQPSKYTAGTLTRVWWKCSKGDDHEWEAQINNRKNGNGCPYCVGNKASMTNSLKTTHPDLAKEWHPTKNRELTPNDVTIGMTRTVWWKCKKGEDHEWNSPLNLRKRGFGCPMCSGKRLVLSNCLATIDPELSEEWYGEKNGILTPYDVTKGSPKKIWWQCPKVDDHIYQSTISNRRRGLGCPICSGRMVVKSNCLSTLRPDLSKEWHPSMNNQLTPDHVTLGSPKKVWWKCPKGEDHEWQATVNGRTQGNGCPYCANKKLSATNNLLVVRPELANEINQTKNRIDPSKILVSSGKEIWWKCVKGTDHTWKASVSSRVNGAGCHVCWGRKVVKSNSLQSKLPELIEEWDYLKNEDDPADVFYGSTKKVWWKCNKGNDHEWEASVAKRAKGSGCPVCLGFKVVKSNSLETLRPDLLKQWNYNRNGERKPSNYTVGSSKKVWWKCPEGKDHEWEASINSRVQGVGCPVCSGYKVVKSNCLQTTHPKIAKEWHPTLNGSVKPESVIGGSPKNFWWKCNKGVDHEWQTSVRKRTQRSQGCPYCTLTPQSKQELQITFELKQFFDIDPKGFKTRINSKLWSIDIYIPEVNLGIEFDGSYWHKDKRDLDKFKTEKLNAEGFQIMRIREEPLKPITEIDVVSKLPFNAKQVTNEILGHIIQAYNIDKKRLQKISKYLMQKGLKNEKALDEYIEMILDEKSEKQRKRSTTAPKPH